MTADHKLGKEGERLASDYILKNNFSLLEQNWRSGRYGEVDIVALDNITREIVFIEVKSRVSSLDDAKEQVTSYKQKQLYKLANSYLYLNKKEKVPCRFDVIAVKINKEGSKLEHIKNAF